MIVAGYCSGGSRQGLTDSSGPDLDSISGYGLKQQEQPQLHRRVAGMAGKHGSDLLRLISFSVIELRSDAGWPSTIKHRVPLRSA